MKMIYHMHYMYIFFLTLIHNLNPTLSIYNKSWTLKMIWKRRKRNILLKYSKCCWSRPRHFAKLRKLECGPWLKVSWMPNQSQYILKWSSPIILYRDSSLEYPLSYYRCYTMEPPLYSLEYRCYSLEYPLHAEISVIFSLYQFSPTKNQNIEKILLDSEPC